MRHPAFDGFRLSVRNGDIHTYRRGSLLFPAQNGLLKSAVRQQHTFTGHFRDHFIDNVIPRFAG